ncbi:MAG: 3-hydroxyacyl-CoA dehydrogenase NAD-binding domain-containing protein [Solirubrobacterales bacterium]
MGRVGVVGAGTMGSGIAQIAILGGFETTLYELDSKQLARGVERLRTGLRRGAERGDWSEEAAKDALARLRTETLIDPLAGCELVIEAVPEELELKRELFGRLAAVCGQEPVLATNTSSLSVTAIAARVPEPQRVVGMHFLNPPARMRLVEIVAGEDSAPQPLVVATVAAEQMGRTPIRARDSIGFVANRCARPFTLEGLRIAGEGGATFGEVDRICRLAGGFRMGPFELMDLIGVDVNFGVARSFFEQSFGEPRWRPHPIQARMVAAGRLGRKSGRGFYVYEQDRPHRGRDPDVDAERPLIEDDEIAALAGDAGPAVLDRIAAQIVNEACFALDEGVASAEDIDAAMTLGFNWPLGPLAWGERLGWARALGTLEALRDERGEAYRPSPLLRAAAAAGKLPS